MPRKHSSTPKLTPFKAVLAHLRDNEQPLPAKDYYLFSDLEPADLAALTQVWGALPVERRRNLMDDLSELSEDNYEVLFDEVFKMALHDPDGEVRATALRALWETEDDALIAVFIDHLQHDAAVPVRASAAGGLGRYVYLGELEELTPEDFERVQMALLDALHSDDDLEVRRRALEALAYATRAEIPELITEAYADPDPKMRVSAVFAMGRSGDARWQPQVEAELHNLNPEIRFEAVRAAGELEMAEVADDLAELTNDVDLQVRDAAVWSLSQVGGEEARDVLMKLLEEAQADGDDEAEEFIEDALTNLDFTDDFHNFTLLGLGEDELEDLDDLDDPDDSDSAGPTGPAARFREN